MNSGRFFLRAIWRAVEHLYTGIIGGLGLYGHVPDTAWLLLQNLFGEYLGWVDLTSASTLRYRALRERTILPPIPEHGIAAELSLIKPLAPSLTEVARDNPWYARQRFSTNPLIEQRAEWVRKIEETYLTERANSIAQTLKDPEKREQFRPLYRIERHRRDCHGAVASAAEQVQLALPDVGIHFPFAEYVTRDDRRVRPTHAAMQNFVAARTWKGWTIANPPVGWNCRCLLRWISRFEARERGWLTKDDKPKFELRWPNSLAEDNWRNQRFPDKGWRTPRFWAAAHVPQEAAA